MRNKRIFIKLQLPQSIQIHNIFHPHLLYKALIDQLSNHINELSPLVFINIKEEWEVEEILVVKSHRGNL